MEINFIKDFYNFLTSNNNFNLIPIFVQLFVLFIFNNFENVDNSKIYRILIGLLSLLITNVLKVIFEKRTKYICKTNSITQNLKSIWNSIVITIIQYAVTYVGPEILYYLPIIGIKLSLLDEIAILNKIIRIGFFITGFKMANLLTTEEVDITISYIVGPIGPFIISKLSSIPIIGKFIKMLNFKLFTISAMDTCNGSPGSIRYILLLFSLIAIIGYEIFLKVENIVGDFEEVLIENIDENLPEQYEDAFEAAYMLKSGDYKGLVDKGLDNLNDYDEY